MWLATAIQRAPAPVARSLVRQVAGAGTHDGWTAHRLSGVGWCRTTRHTAAVSSPARGIATVHWVYGPAGATSTPREPPTPYSTVSRVVGATDVALLADTIDENLRATVATHATREALVVRHQGVRWSYAELDERIEALARGLHGTGVRAGDRVGLWSPNRSEWVLVQYATARLGAIMVALNPAYRMHELHHALALTGCRLLLAAPSFKSSDYRGMWAEVAPGLTAADLGAVFFDTRAWHDLASNKHGGAAVPDTAAAGANTGQQGQGSGAGGAGAGVGGREAGSGDGDVWAAPSASDAVNIQFTSGTTGLPKAACLTHRNILNNGYFVGERLGYTEEDRICIPVPFYHCFGMVMGNLAATSHGATMIVPNDAFEPVSVLETVQAERCTSLYGVPTMFIAELAEPSFNSFDLSSLRTGIMAGSACPEQVMRQVMSRMHMEEVTICYGMTETSPVSLQSGRADSVAQRTRTVGRVHPHVEVQLVDDTGVAVPRGQEGELLTRGYSVMQGYWGQPEATAACIDGEGWMHTGDLGVMDADGYVAVTGRSKDLIIRGGENISPREVEEFLYGHPDVADVQVVAVPDPSMGEAVCACVQLTAEAAVAAGVSSTPAVASNSGNGAAAGDGGQGKGDASGGSGADAPSCVGPGAAGGGQPADEEDGEEAGVECLRVPAVEASVRAFCDGQIAHFKVPAYVLVVPEFPLTVTGKVQKYRLREAAAALLSKPS